MINNLKLFDRKKVIFNFQVLTVKSNKLGLVNYLKRVGKNNIFLVNIQILKINLRI